MEARNITIVSTQNQNKYVVNTDATTLRELKSALAAQNIAYDGMTFYEGLSHTELLTDDAVLPHDVPYKGETTNELVFMLTTPNKKIKSGADTRDALYDTIRELNLQDVVAARYGKNFTQCKNSELMAAIEDAQEAAENVPNVNLEEAFRKLVEILVDEDAIFENEADEVLAILDRGSVDNNPRSPYSDNDIDEMFNFLG